MLKKSPVLSGQCQEPSGLNIRGVAVLIRACLDGDLETDTAKHHLVERHAIIIEKEIHRGLGD